MNKGTIIYAGGFNLPDKSASANRVVNNGKLFAALGFNAVFLGTDYSETHFTGIKDIGISDMYCESRPSNTKQWAAKMFSTENIESLIKKYPDTVAVILYNTPYSLVLQMRKSLKCSSVKLFYDCTEWTKDTDGSLPKRLVKAFDEYFIRKMLPKKTDGMITVSSMMTKAYQGKTDILQLPPLVDISAPIWNQEPIPHTDFEFVFAGIPDGNKESLDKIIDSFLLVNEDARLRIIGVDKQTFLNLYPDFENKLNDNITFMGRLSHTETVRYILSSDCYIFIRQPDRRNNAGFPTKFAEGFSCGIPIITSDISDISAYLENGKNGYIVSPQNKDEIAAAMDAAVQSFRNENTSLKTEFDYHSYIGACENWMRRVGLINE